MIAALMVALLGLPLAVSAVMVGVVRALRDTE
jgi:hypothetical protein